MNKNVRIILAVLVGWLLYGIVWNVVGLAFAALFPAFVVGEPLTDMVTLIIYLIASVPVSILAGFAGARVGAAHAATAVKALAIVNLITGVAVEVMYWDLLPIWWHILFILFIVPATLYGGNLVKPKSN